jgi:predicted HAD superfamily phosphohydrolase
MIFRVLLTHRVFIFLTLVIEGEKVANFIVFDLVGPLSLQDNTGYLMNLIPDGNRILEVVNRYGELLAQEKRVGFEPGDTRVLIMPFMVLHDILEKDVVDAASTSTLTEGAHKLIAWLQSNTWKVFCITTIYEQYAQYVTNRLEIYSHNVACTAFPLDDLRRSLSAEDRELLRDTEKEILEMRPGEGDQQIKEALDAFYLEKLPSTDLGEKLSEIKAVAGRRKLEALERFSKKYSQLLSDWVVVGDSLTDSHMLKALDEAGGGAIAYNADRYALSNATAGLASAQISDLLDVIPAWQKGKRKGLEQAINEKEKTGVKAGNGYFQWLAGRELTEEIIELHRRFRLSG